MTMVGVKFRWVACSMAFLSSVSSRATAQNNTSARITASSSQIGGVFSGEERRFKDVEGYTFGPTKYVFHLLPGGKAFLDWSRPQAAKTGRIFGTYTVTRVPEGVRLKAEFFPSMDSTATEAPATDYFETVVIRFVNGRVNARFVDEPNAPTFRLSRLR